VAAHCLLITPLSLTDLRHSTHGTFRRLRTLLQAIHASGAVLTVATTVPVDTSADALEGLACRIGSDLKQVWGVEARVRVARRTPPSHLPWLMQEIRGAFGYGRTPGTRLLASPELHALLRDEVRTAAPRFIVAHRLTSMFALLRVGGRLPPTFFDMDDVEHKFALRTARSAGLRQKLLNYLWLPGLLFTEWRALRTARRSFVCSALDVRHLSALFFTRTVQALPNAVAIPAVAATVPRGEVVLMVGAYGYAPNADAAEFFINAILPGLRKRLPGVELWLVGAGAEGLPSFKAAPPNVRFLGFVDDLATVYSAARIVVCPVRYGGGTRVKLVEAAAWGKAIVTTTLGAEGLGMEPDRDALFADHPDAFADACVRLIEDDALCAVLGANARRLAVEQFDQERIVARLAGVFVQDVAGSSKEGPP
jgi:hypothetical protein